MAFFSTSVQICCISSHPGGGNIVQIPDYHGEMIDWEALFKERNVMREGIKNGIIPEKCTGCYYLKENEWNSEDYIDEVLIGHWTHCNCNCVYCYTEKDKKFFNANKTYNIYPVIKDMIEKGVLSKNATITFGGGEPTILNEFDDIINFLLDNYFFGIRVHTSGIKYSPALARAINEIRGYVVVSVDAGDSNTYKKIKGVDKYSQVRESIRKYALHTTFLSRYFVGAKYIIIPGINDTIEQLENWLQANYDLGLFTTVLDLEENWYLEHKDNIPKHIFDLVKYAEKRSKDFNTNFELYERLQNVMADYKEKNKTLLQKILKK